jgi:hypothetical protein
VWLKNSDTEEAKKQCSATIANAFGAPFIGIAPRLGEQTFEGRRENLSQANKLSRTYAVLLDALNRHRGKGAQKDNRGARPRSPRRPSHRRQRRGPGGRGNNETRGTTPCSCICTRHRDAEHGRDAGARVNRRQCRTVDAGCTAERHRALRWGIKTPSNTGAIRRKLLLAADTLRS